MSLDLGRLATNLRQADDGLWVAAERESVSYPESGNDVCFQVEERSFWFRHRNRCILAAMRLLPPAQPFFDIGGGNGYVAAALQRADIETVLVEPGVLGARRARARGIPTVACATLESAGFRQNIMPAAGLFDVLEHIADDVGFLRSLRSYLAPGARLYLTVPAYPWLWSHEDDAAGHFRRYTTTSLRRVLTQAGFVLAYSTYFFSILPLPILIARTIPSRLGRRAVTVAHTEREHVRDEGAIVSRVLAAECNAVAGGRRVPFGGSCLAVAYSAD